jgi:hypothetical protein
MAASPWLSISPKSQRLDQFKFLGGGQGLDGIKKALDVSPKTIKHLPSLRKAWTHRVVSACV